jgi:phage tail sheath protein FI
MGFQVSPGVNVTEIDLTTIVPAVSTTEAAIGGVFQWGPIEDRDLISSEDELVARFGKPDSNNFETWFCAANFLAYSNKLWVSRAASNTTYNAVANSGGTAALTLIKNEADYVDNVDSYDANAEFYAKYGGALGNSLKISVCDAANCYVRTITDAELTIDFTIGSNVASFIITDGGANTADANTTMDALLADLAADDWITAGNTTVGTQYMQISAIGVPAGNGTAGISIANVNLTTTYRLSQDVTQTTTSRYWEYFNIVDAAPGTSKYASDRGGVGDELHVVVIDEDGTFSGTVGAAVEVWPNLSRATDALGENGGSIYYKDVLQNSSLYVYWANDPSGMTSNTAENIVTSTNDRAYTQSFVSGADGATESTIVLGDMINAYNQFRNAEEVDVSLVLNGKASTTHGVRSMGLAKYLIENIAEYRKDCVVFISPQSIDSVSNPFQEAEDSILTRNEIGSSSYAVLDSGYKWQYDRYNDVYRWIPFNGDIAGLTAKTDDLRDPWWSPAGFNRGNIKNVTKIAYNPDKADRDILYKAGVNPVVNFQGGLGTVLYGDKTLLAKPSAFDRINVRRLFIVLEKAISTAAKFTLFEFNDEFTRAQFRNLVEPYLRDVQGRRGITDFRVVCDETNNTGEVIDRNEFVGDIYIKPARSINFIQLNFIAVRTGVEFEEVVGRF